VFEAAIDIVYDNSGDENNEEAVADTVTTIAEDTSNGDEIENIVNEGAEDDGEVVTNVGYGDGPEKDTNGPASAGPGKDTNGTASPTEEASYAQDNGLSKGEKAAIAIASIFLLLLLILCCLWRRHLRRQQEEAWGNKSVATEDTAREALAQGSNSFSDGDDDATYRTSDFNNLGLHHSKLDVHMCTSATCDQCNPMMKDPPGVFFISTKGSTALASIAENDNDDIMSGSGRGASPLPGDIQLDEHEQTPAQKGVFSGFRKRTTKSEYPIQRPTSPYEMTAIEMEI
jgi:hypothetical protein